MTVLYTMYMSLSSLGENRKVFVNWGESDIGEECLSIVGFEVECLSCVGDTLTHVLV